MAKRKISLREFVVRRAKGRCEYCCSPAAFAHQRFSLEHVQPRSRKGQRTAANLALSCQGCNNHKYNRTKAYDPISGNAVPLFHPRKHLWADHFAWNDDGTLVLGLTRIGRASVEALQLNRVPLVNLRRVLVAAGEHPPDSSDEAT